jgi:hypothetical protein
MALESYFERFKEKLEDNERTQNINTISRGPSSALPLRSQQSSFSRASSSVE